MSKIRYPFIAPAPVIAVGLLSFCGLCLNTTASAAGFGVYDARALAMGGTAVAVGDFNQAHQYNPSLIALHKGHEDRTRDGRHSLAIIRNFISDATMSAYSAYNGDLEERLTLAADLLEEVPTPESATIALDAATDLRKAMRDFEGENVEVDGYLGYSVTIPADGEGGAFFIGSRLIGTGTPEIDADDFKLLDEYVEALEFIASAGAEGVAHGDLFNDENKLISPVKRIQSRASGTGMALTEIGISGAKQWTFWGIPIALGTSPKFVQVRAFGDTWKVEGDSFNSSTQIHQAQYFNFDLGATAVYKERFRVGIAVKDVRTYSFDTTDKRTVTLKPRSRFGLAYVHPKLRMGIDYDLVKNENFHTLTPEQLLSLGAEYEPIRHLKLRLGYQHDQSGLADDRSSMGVSWTAGWFETELALSSGYGLAAQFSIYH